MSEGRVYISSAFAEGKVDRKLRMLEAVARILSDNYNVSVSFSPDGECKTTPESMILPYDKNVDEALILGLCGHETGHLKHTDFEIGKSIARHKKVNNRALLYIITNCLEDVRIEAAMEKEYPGFVDMFKRTVPYIREKKKSMLEREEKIKELKAQGKTAKEIAKVIAKDCQEEVARLASNLRQAGFSEEYVQFEVDQLKDIQTTPMAEISKVLDVLYLRLREYPCDWYGAETIYYVEDFLLETAQKIHQCESTEDTLELALEIYKIIEEQQKQQRKKIEEEQKKREKEQKDKKNKKNGGGNKDGDEDDSNPDCDKDGNSKGKPNSKKSNKGGKGKPQKGNNPGSKPSKGPSGSKKDSQESKGNLPHDQGESGQDQQNQGGGCAKTSPYGDSKDSGGSSNFKPKEGSEDGIPAYSDELLTVGCEVKHLHDDHKIGVVKEIDKATQEVIVEWREKPSKEQTAAS